MLNVEMLPAGHGDALLVEYGMAPTIRRILVDGGPYYSYDDPGSLRERLHALTQEGNGEFELLIVTHVDTDHIDGIIRLLQDKALEGLVFKDIWFNGWKQIQKKATGVLAGKHGEYLGALLEHLDLPWNSHPKLQGAPLMVPESGDLPTFDLDGDAKITLLSPGPQELENLRKEWPKSLSAADFSPGDTAAALEQLKNRARYGPPKAVLGSKPDDSAANGSSIAVLFEYGDERALLAGDAWPQVLVRSLARWKEQHSEIPQVQYFKLAHHGSYGNLSKALIQSLRTKQYLFSSSSAYHGHPDQNTIRLILKHDIDGKPHLVFNYLSPSTKPWANPGSDAGYTVSFPTGVEWPSLIHDDLE
ncbi:MAG: hypothetical protein N0E44_22160 [Candidatus Thiodiazotropha lotti]|nr:hypothetical protein [Candidatus Thiodiazotropha lotti]MCW4222578.1 hypothetical protein [Candidatus Thiodiazotropha lotti]